MALTKVTGHVIKSDTNITSHNINSSGIVTAVTFDGNVSGVAVTFTGDSTIGSLGITTNLTVGGNIDANGDLDVDGHTNLDNVNVVGVLTVTGAVNASHSTFGNLNSTGITIQNTNASINFTDTNNNPDYSVIVDAGVFDLNSVSPSVNIIKINTDGHIDIGTNVDFAAGIDVTGNATVSGNLSVGGVLTYQDVTNIDSIGIVTARAGIVVQDDATFQTANGNNILIDKSDNSLKFGDNVRAQFGNSQDLSIYHDGTNTIIDNDTAALIFRSDQYRFRDKDDGDTFANFILGGAVELYHNGEKRIETASTGVLLPDMSTTKGRLAFGDFGTRIEGGAGGGADDGLHFMTNSVMKWQMNPDGDLIPSTAGAVDIGSASKEIGNIYIADDKKLYLGSSQDVEIYHSSGNVTMFDSTTNRQVQLKGDGGLLIRAGGNQNIANFVQSGVTLYHSVGNAYTARFVTTSTGITVTGEVAASQDYPNVRPALDFNFAATKKLDPRLEYQRSGGASFTDEFGKLIKVGDNTPRFNHNFGTGESLGLLMEESSTNLSRYSEQASGTTNWTQFGTISENVIEAPDGTMTADKLEAPTSGHGLINIAASWTANVPHTFSIFAKSGEFNRIGIRLYDGTSYFMRTTVNLDTGEAVNNAAGTLRVDKFANGWWRISTTGTPVATYTYNSLASVEPHNTQLVQTADPSSSKEGIYIWGWQMEAKPFPSSYIATNGAEVTRGQDFLAMTGSDVDDIFNPTEGTMFYEASVTDLTNANQPIVSFRNSLNTGEEYFSMGHATGGSAGSVRVWAKNSDGQNVHLTTHTGLVADTPYKHILGYAYNNYSDAFTQGTTSKQVNTTSGNHAMMATGVVDELRFGAYYTNLTTYSLDSGHIKRFSYWRQRLTNAQLKTYIS